MNQSFIVRINDDKTVSWIPFVSGNADFEAYNKWLAEGNTPEPWPAAKDEV